MIENPDKRCVITTDAVYQYIYKLRAIVQFSNYEIVAMFLEF